MAQPEFAQVLDQLRTKVALLQIQATECVLGAKDDSTQDTHAAAVEDMRFFHRMVQALESMTMSDDDQARFPFPPWNFIELNPRVATTY